MVANPTVNMGGALLMTSLAKARAAGVPEDRIVYAWGGASAEEPRDYLVRDQFYESHPQNAVLKAVMDLVEGDGKKFDAIEFYSCFPCVPKMARRTLGLGPDVQPTVTGGLTFFGAPLNTYMTHAACAMVRKLRGGAKLGLLYGQGGFVTKHHGLVLSREAPKEALAQDTSVQAEADRAKRAVPEFVTEAGRQGQGRELYGDLRRQGRCRARRGDAAHRGGPPDARRAFPPATRERWRICATWTARRWGRWAISSRRMMACWSGGWGRCFFSLAPRLRRERWA